MYSTSQLSSVFTVLASSDLDCEGTPHSMSFWRCCCTSCLCWKICNIDSIFLNVLRESSVNGVLDIEHWWARDKRCACVLCQKDFFPVYIPPLLLLDNITDTSLTRTFPVSLEAFTDTRVPFVIRRSIATANRQQKSHWSVKRLLQNELAVKNSDNRHTE